MPTVPLAGFIQSWRPPPEFQSGLRVSAELFQHRESSPDSHQHPAGACESFKELRHQHVFPESELVEIVVKSQRWVWAFACILAGLTGALAILMRSPDLPEDEEELPQ